MRAAISLVVVLLFVSGCGGHKQSAMDKAEMDLYLSSAHVRITSDVLKNGSDLPSATNSYIQLIRQYEPELGAQESKRRLATIADQVQDWCASCAASLDRERETIG
jgi:hypothetical protein